MKLFFAATAGMLINASLAFGQASPDCSRALIPATASTSYNELINLSLAWNLSEASYNQAKSDFGVNAVIYSVPVGATYGEYHQNAASRAESLHTENFQQRSFAYATSALTPTNLAAYKACLASTGGLAVVAQQLGHDHYVISIKYIPSPTQTKNLPGKLVSSQNIQQQSANEMRGEIARIRFGAADREFTVVPVDRAAEATIDIAVGTSYSRTLLLPPLEVPALPPPAPTFQWKLVRTDDCRARDLSCSVGAQPRADECNQARLNLVSVCWKGGANKGFPPFTSCGGQPPDWCTYKNYSLQACVAGGRPGNLYVCVKE